MGESAVLSRSFSHPSSASRESNEEFQSDTMRALTESISFGRFMSESLAWEKWSTFSHNRYLEEVEQFSKPGSVAQKKAFFEAHYKKRAAMKAAALVEGANGAANNPPVLDTVAESLDRSPISSGVTNTSSNEAVDKQQEIGKFTQLTHSTDLVLEQQEMGRLATDPTNTSSNEVVDKQQEIGNFDTRLTHSTDPIVEQQETGCLASDVAHSDGVDASYLNESAIYDDECLVTSSVERGEQMTEVRVQVENATLVENSKQLEGAGDFDRIPAAPEEKISKKGTSVKESLDLPLHRNKRQMNCPSKPPSQSRASKIQKSSYKLADFRQPKNGTHVAPNSMKPEGDLMDKRRLMLKSVNMSLNLGSQLGEGGKSSLSMLKDSSSKLQKSSSKQADIRQPKHGTRVALNSTKPGEDLMDKKRLMLKSVNRSLNVGSQSGEGGKSSLSMLKDSPSTLQNATRASVNGVSRLLPSIARKQPEDRRSKTMLNKSVSGGIVSREMSQTLTQDCSRLPSTSGSKVRSSVVSLPFSLKSEERASKRKEFFQKLEERNSAKEAEKQHQHNKKSGLVRAKPWDSLHQGSQSLSVHQTNKIPLTQPRSPKLGRKPVPGVVHETSSRHPRRPSVNERESSKPVGQKRNQIAARSVTSLPKKKAHENASPNIQQ